MQRSILRDHALIVKLIADRLQKFNSLIRIRLQSKVTFFIFQRIRIIFIVFTENAAVTIGHTRWNIGVGAFLTRLSHGVNDILAVNQQGDGLAHGLGLLSCLTVKE